LVIFKGFSYGQPLSGSQSSVNIGIPGRYDGMALFDATRRQRPVEFAGHNFNFSKIPKEKSFQNILSLCRKVLQCRIHCPGSG
jgi:hypothetical protein